MKRKYSLPVQTAPNHHAVSGFTLVELIVAVAVSSILGLAVVTNYIMQTRSYEVQREMAHMQQNLRAAMFMLSNDIRNSGRDPERSGRYGIQSIVRNNPDADDLNGYPGLTLNGLVDINGDGMADPGSIQTIRYQVMDQDGNDRRELRRCTGGCATPDNWQLIMDGIEDIGFAYAYDNGNGDLARFNGNANAPEIWAIDSNDSNVLDTNIDSNGDGDIDINDNFAAALNPTVALSRIRAVRIWILARSRKPYTNFEDTGTYILGRKQLNMADAANAGRWNFRHLMISSVVALQNYELNTNM